VQASAIGVPGGLVAGRELEMAAVGDTVGPGASDAAQLVVAIAKRTAASLFTAQS